MKMRLVIAFFEFVPQVKNVSILDYQKALMTSSSRSVSSFDFGRATATLHVWLSKFGFGNLDAAVIPKQDRFGFFPSDFNDFPANRQRLRIASIHHFLIRRDGLMAKKIDWSYHRKG